MSATVFGTAKFGATSESSSTGLFLSSIAFTGASEVGTSPNHVGQDVGVSISNERIDISIDGVITTKGSGMVVGMADLVTLANATSDSSAIFADLLKVAPVANASVIITQASMTRTNNGFETGSLTGVFYPGIDTTATYVAS